jgi:hypothetical protein
MNLKAERIDRARRAAICRPPVAALTILGVILAVLRLFVAGNLAIVVVGLLSIFGADLLQVAASRRS